jgi:hypothetical protein
MSNLYREPFIDASYQISVHLTEVSEEKINKGTTVTKFTISAL